MTGSSENDERGQYFRLGQRQGGPGEAEQAGGKDHDNGVPPEA